MQKEQLDDKKVGSAYFENSDPELNVVEDNSEEKSNFSKITIIIIVALVLFVIIGGIFYYKKSVELAKKESSIEQEINSFYDMDEMIVNLDTNGRGNSFVRLRLSLEVKNAESLHILKQYAPKVQDIVQVYVRGLRPDDLRGSISLYNIREQLLLRINKVVYPAQVINIYFRDVLVQ